MDLHGEQPSKQEPIPPQEAEAIRRLLKRIGRRHPVRRVAETFLEGETVYPLTTKRLLQSLKTPRPYHWRRQTVAAWMLGYPQDTSEDAEAVEKHLIKMVDIWGIQNVAYRLLRAVGWSWLLFALFVITSMFSVGHATSRFVIFFMLLGIALLSGLFAMCVLPVLTVVESGMMTNIRVAAAASLGRLHSVEALPALARACLHGPKSRAFARARSLRNMRGAALTAMEEILPCVTEYDYARLAAGIPNLCKVLDILATTSRFEAQQSESVALRILSTLGKVGDGRAAEIVERVSLQATVHSVRTAANDVLPLLQDRKRQASAANTLLRGAAPNMEGQETLLRATTPAHQTDPTELLRPNLAQISPAILNSQQSEPQLQEPQTFEAETNGEFMRVYEPLAPETLVQQTSEH